MRSKKGNERVTKILFFDRMRLNKTTDLSRKKRHMKYTEAIEKCLKERGIEKEDPRLQDWQKAFAQVKDPRRKQGQRFTLTSMLLLALAAILSNHLSELAIAQWGAGQNEEVKKALGFEKGKTPHQTTIQRLFRRLSVDELEAAFRRIFLQIFEQDKGERGERAVAIDGKVQKGRLKFEEEDSYPIHAVSIVDHETGIVLTQGHVEKGDTEPKGKQASEAMKSEQTEEQMKSEQTDKKKENKGKPKSKKSEQKEEKKEKKESEQEEKKQKSELAVAYRLILQIDWKGKVLTGDALYCQRCLCLAILLAGGDYLFIVKANQPQLFEDLRLLFAPPAAAKRAGEGILRLPEQQAQTIDKGHGRLEIRSIRVSSELSGYSDWPGLEQVFEIRRRWQYKGEWREEVRYGVTSLPATVAIPERLLKLKRGHWTIENRLHYVKDVTLGEDRSTIHADNGPKIMAALRNTAVSLLRRAGFSTIVARMRHNSGHPEDALQVLSLSLS
jgi:predicted transposase YbfD/YdcC